ncbi:hypothetical protein [Paenibacillus sp. sgz5001063]
MMIDEFWRLGDTVFYTYTLTLVAALKSITFGNRVSVLYMVLN